MPYTIAVSFDKFVDNMSITGNQGDTAQSRCEAILSLLSKEFTILEAFPMGSLVNGTSLKGYADADIMLVLHYGFHIKNKTPEQALQGVRDKLSEYDTRMAKKNGQAVTLYFKTWPSVDIVPACRVVDGSEFYCYEIPNMNDGEWIQARPHTHIQTMKGLSNNKLNMIKIMKEWNRKHSGYLSSYHIEVMISSYDDFYSDYAWHVFQCFEYIQDKLKAQIPSPSGLGGYVDEYLGYFDRQEAQNRIETAISSARLAWSNSYNGDEKGAIERYGKIFGERFPSYG